MGRGRDRTLDERLRAVRAAAREGLLTAADFERRGFNRMAVTRLCARGLLVRVLPEVYRLGDARSTELQRWLAAQYWSGGVLSHFTAAAHHGLWGVSQPAVHVTVPARGMRSQPGVVVHASALPDWAVAKHGPLRVTTVERTLLDLAGCASDEQLHCAVESAWHLRRLRPQRALKRLDAMSTQGIPGAGRLRRVLADCLRRGRAMESPFEVRLFRAMRAAGIPEPQVQVPIVCEDGSAYRADFVFERARVIVEANGWRAHWDRVEEDMERTARLVSLGYAVLPVTPRMFQEKRDLVLPWIREAVCARSRAPRTVLVFDGVPAAAGI